MKNVIGKLSSLVLSAVLAMSLSACGQNPHVLGADYQNTDRHQGPTADGTGMPGDGGTGKPGNGKPGQNGKPKEGCIFAAQIMTFDSRPLAVSEKENTEITSTLGFAFDPMFETSVMDVITAKVVMYNVASEKAKAHPGALACFRNKDVCGRFDGADSMAFNLLHHVNHYEVATTLNEGKSLFFNVPAVLDSRDAQLQLEVLVEKCGPQSGDSKEDSKLETPKAE
jgi:hypothetical protein